DRRQGPGPGKADLCVDPGAGRIAAARGPACGACARIGRTPRRARRAAAPVGRFHRQTGELNMNSPQPSLLPTIDDPANLRKLDRAALGRLAVELRTFLLESVSRTGGHLSSNLGTVELTIALHYVFDTPRDRLVWDVGHQSYAHKILT